MIFFLLNLFFEDRKRWVGHMGVGFIFEGNSLQISDFFHSKQDAEQGNPYNCTFTLKINSHGFSGVAPFEYDIRKLRLFLVQIDDLYHFRCERAILQDIGYGSSITFTRTDRTGHFTVNGTLYGDGRVHSLEFEFRIDQTVLLPFYKTFCNLLNQAT